MNKVFGKIFARTILQVLWERQGAMSGESLLAEVLKRIGRPPNSKHLMHNQSDVIAAIWRLVDDGRVEVRKDVRQSPWPGEAPGASSRGAYRHDFVLPVLDRLAAIMPEVT